MLDNTCLAGGGAAGARLRAVDWASNPLGPVEGWPLSLQTAVRILLSSEFPMMIHWGPELITFYNDAYAPSLGRKHPGNLGRPAYEWWSEMWDQLTPIFDRVLSGQSFFVENARYTPDRDGAQKDAYFTHCHSPLWDDQGKVAGIFLVVTETTR
ncbi:PAS domain-containing protein [Teichococcus vastitatis]|uniref:PAS domain-containing protein n=1 Tax=Teichococcus vastitatis TaxID=2307076 RepID=UPI000E7472FD|nr:PAS domain-containing protein [Pseudoroseomonas vastitatis]